MTNSTITDRWPDPRRADATLAVVEQRRAPDLAGRTEILARTVRRWRTGPWPTGLLSDSLFVGEDARSVLRYALWTDQDAHRRAPSAPQAIEYVRYRDSREPGETRTPGCLALPYLIFDGADPQRLRDWVDTVFEALEAAPSSADDEDTGGLGAVFHVSLDGRRILNYAEWVGLRHHDRFMGATGEGDDTPPDPAAMAAWQKVQEFPGIVESGVNRFNLYGTAEPVGG